MKNLVLFHIFFFIGSSCFSQNSTYIDCLGDATSVEVDSSMLRYSFGKRFIDEDYFVDSLYLKHTQIEHIEISMWLENKSNLYIKEGVLPYFKHLSSLTIVRRNSGEIYLPKDLDKCESLEDLQIDLRGKPKFKIPKEIQLLTRLKYFTIVPAKGCFNRRFISDIKELIRNSKSIEIVRVYYKKRRYKSLVRYGAKHGVKVNPEHNTPLHSIL
jgi:hypothetical protein